MSTPVSRSVSITPTIQVLNENGEPERRVEALQAQIVGYQQLTTSLQKKNQALQVKSDKQEEIIQAVIPFVLERARIQELRIILTKEYEWSLQPAWIRIACMVAGGLIGFVCGANPVGLALLGLGGGYMVERYGYSDHYKTRQLLDHTFELRKLVIQVEGVDLKEFNGAWWWGKAGILQYFFNQTPHPGESERIERQAEEYERQLQRLVPDNV